MTDVNLELGSRPSADIRLRDAEGPTLTITRLIDAPRELVWEVWTDPKHCGAWGPEGFEYVIVEQDFREGGRWRGRLRPYDGGRELWQSGVYREIVEGERIVFTFAWEADDGGRGHEMLITLTFEDANALTRLTLRQTGFESVKSRDGHGEGWGQALDALAAHARKVAAERGRGSAS